MNFFSNLWLQRCHISIMLFQITDSLTCWFNKLFRPTTKKTTTWKIDLTNGQWYRKHFHVLKSPRVIVMCSKLMSTYNLAHKSWDPVKPEGGKLNQLLMAYHNCMLFIMIMLALFVNQINLPPTKAVIVCVAYRNNCNLKYVLPFVLNNLSGKPNIFKLLLSFY